MKKVSLIMLLIVVLLVAPANTAYACGADCTCTCKCCKQQKTAGGQLKKATNNLLAETKACAKKYGWSIDTKVTKNTATRRWTKVHYYCAKTRTYMDVVIRATVTKTGVKTFWWFKDKKGSWCKTYTEGIKGVLKRVGKK